MSTVATLRGVSKKYGATTALRPYRPRAAHRCHRAARPQRRGEVDPAPAARHRTAADHRHHHRGRPRGDRRGGRADRGAAAAGLPPQEVGLPRRSTAFDFLDYVAVLKEWTDTPTRHREVMRVLDLVDLGG